MRIAIIGSGISGMAAAWLLNKNHEIDLYEKNNYIGGHSNTVEVNYDGKKIAVDTGFIVFNHQTYPNLTALFKQLNVETFASNMSFAASINDGHLEYAGTNLKTVFAQKKNIFNLKFLLMLKDILKFNKYAVEILESEEDCSLEDFLNKLKLGKYFREFYLLPMAACIWSCPLDTMKKYPAKSFVRFFLNHGLLTVANQPEWRTVKGGSKEYVKLLCQSFADKIHLNCEIKKIKKLDDGKIEVAGKIYDKVIIASHPDQALSMLDDSFNEKIKTFLSNFKYQKNIAILHRDQNLMPKNKKVWSSWNYLKNPQNNNSEAVALTYWMNLLQNIDEKYPLFVTLNPTKKIDPNKIFASFEYEHPIFDNLAIQAQTRAGEIQGLDGLYFCGAYLRYGFHEDGLLSAIKIAEKFGVNFSNF